MRTKHDKIIEYIQSLGVEVLGSATVNRTVTIALPTSVLETDPAEMRVHLAHLNEDLTEAGFGQYVAGVCMIHFATCLEDLEDAVLEEVIEKLELLKQSILAASK